ncbi:hypothetical protein BN1007_200166 [Klebsiella variicola]|nr:hypothetical protein BN1007_160069 [Klebsiella variicola]CTQ09202.1 hypothetical protein BN1007_200166 [Klebsiella variicola]
MKNPHNRSVDIAGVKPLYIRSAYVLVGIYCSRISRYSERVFAGDIMSLFPRPGERRR